MTWTYDAASQLTREQRSGSNSYVITYAYDGAGNRTKKRDGGVPTTYAYDAANELLWTQDTSGRTTYSYDGAGNTTRALGPTGQRMTYAWDGENRLTQVALPSGVTDQFSYDGDGKRVQKVDSGGTSRFLWDGEWLLLETDASNVIQVVYTLASAGNRDPISQRRGGVVSYYLYDGQNSTRQLADGTGLVTDSYLYDAYGNTLTSSGTTANPYRYVGSLGYYYDHDTLNYYIKTNILYTNIGRFISRNLFSIYSYNFNGLNLISSRSPLGLDTRGFSDRVLGAPPLKKLPPAGFCVVRLCCYPTLKYGASHCFVLVTNSIGQSVFYTSHPEWKFRWQCFCSNFGGSPWPNPGFLVGESGGYGTGFETNQPGTTCTTLSTRTCSWIQNCLQAAVDAQSAAGVCYIGSCGPNSNTGARTYLTLCGYRAVPLPPLLYPAYGWPGQGCHPVRSINPIDLF